MAFLRCAAKCTAIYFVLAFSVIAQGAVPQSINYQGYLTDSGGAPINGPINVTFAIYTVSTGGTALWSDAQIVNTDDGLFSILLGTAINPFPAGLFDTQVWIGIAVDGDPEMTPRRFVSAVAYAIESDNASTLQGQGPAAFDQSSHVTDTANPHNVTAAQSGALVPADLAVHTSNSSAHHVRYSDSEAVAAVQAADGPGSNIDADFVDGIDGSVITMMQAQIAALETSNAALQASNTALQASNVSLQTQVTALAANSVLALDGVLTMPDAQTMLVSGVNLQIVNGTGATDDTINGQGNLIVGYDEVRIIASPVCSLGVYEVETDCTSNGGIWAVSHKSGSHNIVVGKWHNYSDSSGLVAGENNDIRGHGASVTGGSFNTASGSSSSVSGGANNTASGVGSSISGGKDNTASINYSSVSGGFGNLASGYHSSVSGGSFNVASGFQSSVSGGEDNTASGDESSVSGGRDNIAVADFSSVSGGQVNQAIGLASSVSGGQDNRAISIASSVSGGRNNIAGGLGGSISGGAQNETNSEGASVSSGRDNVAFFPYSSVSGGQDNQANGVASSVSGGRNNIAGALAGSISGGGQNETNAEGSSVSGGFDNTTSGVFTSVSGGDAQTCSATGTVCAEGVFNPPD